MTDTVLWIRQARSRLKRARWGGRANLADCLQDLMTQIENEKARADLGCGENCRECSWGTIGGHTLPRETCKLLVFQEAVKAVQTKPPKALSGRREVATLLELLDSFPLAKSR